MQYFHQYAKQGFVVTLEDNTLVGGLGTEIKELIAEKQLSNVTVSISILNPNAHGRDNLLFWMDVPKLDPEYEKQKNKYKLPEVKPNNTYYTN